MEKKALVKQIIFRGHLTINLPVFIAVIIVVSMVNILQWPWIVGLLGGSFLGYVMWGKLIQRWRDWALKLGVDRDELLQIADQGKVVLFSKEIFEKIIQNDSN